MVETIDGSQINITEKQSEYLRFVRGMTIITKIGETSDILVISVSQGTSSNNGNTNNGDENGNSEGSPIMIFITIIGIIVIIGIVALVVVIRR